MFWPTLVSQIYTGTISKATLRKTSERRCGVGVHWVGGGGGRGYPGGGGVWVGGCICLIRRRYHREMELARTELNTTERWTWLMIMDDWWSWMIMDDYTTAEIQGLLWSLRPLTPTTTPTPLATRHPPTRQSPNQRRMPNTKCPYKYHASTKHKCRHRTQTKVRVAVEDAK